MCRIVVDERGVVYLGKERYMAGTVLEQGVTCWVPGAWGPASCVGSVVRAWEVFREDPRYENVVATAEVSGDDGVDFEEDVPW